MNEHLEDRTPVLSAIIGFLLVVAAVVVTRVFGAVVGDSLNMMTRTAISLGRMWLLAGVLIALVLYWEQRPLESIGIQHPTVKTIGLGVGGFIATLVIFSVLSPIIDALELGSTQGGVETLNQLPVWMVGLAAITAGVTEEIIFRGYLLERIGEATGALWVGAVISAVMFALVHLPQWDTGGTLMIGVWAAIVTVFYVWTRDLGATILLHTLNDLFQFIVFSM